MKDLELSRRERELNREVIDGYKRLAAFGADRLGGHTPEQQQAIREDRVRLRELRTELERIHDLRNGIALDSIGQVVQDLYDHVLQPEADNGSREYSDYLGSEHWQTVREIALDFADYRCQVCYSETRPEVHHRTYDRKGHERLSDVIVLCHDCHAKFHDKLP